MAVVTERTTRRPPLTWTLAGAGLNDLLQAGFATLTHKANELEQRVRG
ncbi:MAG TPA: hypothetical protein VGJ23_03405 [Gaiellaceae bacterium]|jgi:hypothetical protein